MAGALYKTCGLRLQASSWISSYYINVFTIRKEKRGRGLCHVIWWGASSISMRKVSIGVSPISLKKKRCSRHFSPMERRAGRRSKSFANLDTHTHSEHNYIIANTIGFSFIRAFVKCSPKAKGAFILCSFRSYHIIPSQPAQELSPFLHFTAERCEWAVDSESKEQPTEPSRNINPNNKRRKDPGNNPILYKLCSGLKSLPASIRLLLNIKTTIITTTLYSYESNQ